MKSQKQRLSKQTQRHDRQRKRKRPAAKQQLGARAGIEKQKQSSQRKQKQKNSKAKRVRTTKKQPARGFRKKQRKQSLFTELLLTVGLTSLFFLLIFHLTIRVYKVEGYSMTPTINDQDQLLVYRWGTVRRFSLIYFEMPEKKERMVRRVIGLPGEEVSYRDGQLFIGGEEIPEHFLSQLVADLSTGPVTEDFTLQEMTEQTKIPEGCYFVLGDNRLHATDSRYFGFVQQAEVIGTVEARIFPIHTMGQF